MGCGSLQYILKGTHTQNKMFLKNSLTFQKFTDTLVASQSNSVKEKFILNAPDEEGVRLVAGGRP